MSATTTVGTDNIAPTYNPSGLWTIWEINAVFNGANGLNMYVPKINDYVIDPTAGILYIVTNVNLNNYISTLQQIQLASLPLGLTNQNQLLAPSIPNTANVYRLYFDSTTTPYTMNIDAALIIYNASVVKAKFFLGTDIVTNPQSIAVNIDNNGDLVSDSVPLISFSLNNENNLYTKIVPTGYTNQLLADGDQVTVVFYNAAGQIASIQVLTVVVTNAYVGQDSASKLVSGLTLQSPFMSVTEPNTLLLPSNVSIKNLVLTGIVNYNDGTSVALSANSNTGFMVYGLEQAYRASLLQSVPLSLTYTLGNQERSLVNQNYNGKTVSTEFTLKIIGPNFDYQFALYPIPFYAGGTLGFVTKWFLLSMTRNLFLEVTDYMTFSTGSNINGTLYSTQQALIASLKLSLINNNYAGINYSQSIAITLYDPTTGPNTIYSIEPDTSISTAPYGNNLRAKSLNTANNSLDITNLIYNFADWLNAIYYNNLPVTNVQLETKAPVPTHFDVYYSNQPMGTSTFMANANSARFQITQWNSPLQLGTSNIALYSTILIRFLSSSWRYNNCSRG